MLYELLYQFSEKVSFLRLLRYITFRSIAAFLTAFIVGIIIAPWFIKKLRILKYGQSIRDDGPESHQAKAGTPTMGGIFVILAVLFAAGLWVRFNHYVLVVGLAIILFALIGFLDDFRKIKAKNTKGISAKVKLILQTLSAGLLLTLMGLNPQNWQDNRYALLIKNHQNMEITNFALHAQMPKHVTWDRMGADGNTVPMGEYRLIFITEDVFGGRKEHPLTNWLIPRQYGQVDMDFYVDATTNRTLTATRTFHWHLKAPQPEAPTGYSECDGQLVVPQKSNLFFSFYLPYYSKPIFVWPPILGIIFYIFAIVSFSNATNLSDGLDGLAAGMGIMLFIPFAIFAYVIGNIKAASYLLFPFMNGVSEITVILSALIGAFAAFLWHNVHPAEVFMGDTGSLCMGGTIATIAIMLKQEVLLVVAGGMFVLEAVSVTLQIFWYKNFKKRIFKMSPIHHHFELSGWKETQVVVRFWIISALCALAALAALKIR